MWPLCFLVKKLIKVERDSVGFSVGNHSQMVDNYSLEQDCFTEQSYATGLPRSHSVDVPHVNQLFNWDCGLACVLMVLRTLGLDHCDLQSLANLCSTTSIWTVDLAYLLQKFSVRFSFLTVTLGANPSFSTESYYKEELPRDVGRVDTLFRKARATGITIENGAVRCLEVTKLVDIVVSKNDMLITAELFNGLSEALSLGLSGSILLTKGPDDIYNQCRSISSEELSILILSGQCIAVALVDKYKLSCQSWYADIYFSEHFGGNAGYIGHYIVICGYDVDSKQFEIRDPASPRKCERISMGCFDAARKSFGTDEDILLSKCWLGFLINNRNRLTGFLLMILTMGMWIVSDVNGHGLSRNRNGRYQTLHAGVIILCKRL